MMVVVIMIVLIMVMIMMKVMMMVMMMVTMTTMIHVNEYLRFSFLAISFFHIQHSSRKTEQRLAPCYTFRS